MAKAKETKVVKEIKEPVKKVSTKTDELNNLWDVIKEMQQNLDFINDKLQKVITRMGL